MALIFILELEDNKYYVSKTTNIEFRLKQHINLFGDHNGQKKYKSIKILKIINNCDDI